MNAVARKMRISARVIERVHDVIEKGASLSGATVNQFMVSAAVKEAHAIIEKETQIRISIQDAELLVALLENPPKPNARLLRAAERYKETKSRAEKNRTTNKKSREGSVRLRESAT